MLRTKEFFIKEFQKQMKFNKRFAHSNIGYGENVMPVLEIYSKLSEYEERESFKDALETFLSDSDPEKRNFAVDLCLGFFIFRDAIAR